MATTTLPRLADLRRRFSAARNRRALDELAHEVARAIRQVADEADSGDGGLSEEAQQLFDQLQALLSEIDAKIQRQHVIDDLDQRIAGGRRPLDRADRGFQSSLPEFSLRGMIASAIGSPIPGLDLARSIEISQELRTRSPRQFGGFPAPIQSLYLRADYVRRLERRATISTGLPAAGPGGSLVPLDLAADRYIDSLRARTVVVQAGAQVISDLVGNLDIPRMKRTGQVGWFNEGDDIIDTDEEFDRVSFRPKHCGAISTYSRNMLLQSTPDIEMLLRDDLSKLLALDMDRVALTGSGQSAEPLGICRNPLVPKVTTTAFDYIGNVEMRATLSGANVPLESLAWVGNSRIDGWSLSALDAMSRPLGKDLVYLGLPDYTSNVCTAPAVTGPPALPAIVNPLILGAWSDLYICYWSALDILPNALADSVYRKGAVMVRALLTGDVNLRHPEGFVWQDTATGPVMPAPLGAPSPAAAPARERAAVR